MIVCVGAANALANPKRLLKAVPGALYEVGTAVTVALTVAPQLVESVQRVRRARRLRAGRTRGPRAVKGIVVPVLEDAMDRSLRLAAAMDSRGYGRRAYLSPGVRVLIAVLRAVRAGRRVRRRLRRARRDVVVARRAAAGGWGWWWRSRGSSLGGRRVRRTAYRPDPWRWPETLVVLAGVGSCVLLFVSARVDPANLYPSLSPLRWPEVSLVHVVSLLVAVLPAFVAPRPPSSEVVR